MELDSRKMNKRNRMMRSNGFDTQEVIEIGRKEAGESRGFPILCMGIIDVFQMEGKECEDQVRLKMFRRKYMPERGRCFSMGSVTLFGPVAVDEERLEVVARNSAGVKGEQKDE